MEWPTMNTEEIANLAEDFANDLAARLTEFNERYPDPEMSSEAWERFKDQSDRVTGLTPENMKPLFQIVFCRYMGSRYGLAP